MYLTKQGGDLVFGLPSQLIARWGACGKAPGIAQNRRPMPQPAEMRARRACVVVDVWGTR